MKLNSWLIVWTDQLNCKIIFVHCGPIISILSSIFDLELQSEGEASSQYPSIFKHTAPVGVLQREWRNWNKIKTRLRFYRFLLCTQVSVSITKRIWVWIQYMAFNHSSPRSEQHKFSPPISISYQTRENVMRINEMITRKTALIFN